VEKNETLSIVWDDYFLLESWKTLGLGLLVLCICMVWVWRISFDSTPLPLPLISFHSLMWYFTCSNYMEHSLSIELKPNEYLSFLRRDICNVCMCMHGRVMAWRLSVLADGVEHQTERAHIY
jgi:hypothetical protein